MLTLILAISLVASLLHQSIAINIDEGILYPRESESRDVKVLDGIWNFKLSPPGDSLSGFRSKWYKSELAAVGETIPMPVPASYNDVTTDKRIRDHVGLVWYDRTFFVSSLWQQNKRVWLRFGSVCYAAQVWLNGELILSHEIGHLPFQTEVTRYLRFGDKNLLTVAVDNTLLQASVPQGKLEEVVNKNLTSIYQTYTFDFFNYAGIDRPVHLYTTPMEYIDDITVNTDVEPGGVGAVYYRVSVRGNSDPNTTTIAKISLVDKKGQTVASDTTLGGKLLVPAAKLWWPYLMHPEPGYLYQLQVEVSANKWVSKDVYRLPVGIRTLRWNNTSFLINGKPIYIRGFGRHEDFYIKGKGLDLSVSTRDYNLIKWVGANSYRTSHYPYAEEIMDMADEEGIMIIDECPSVDTEAYSTTLLTKHKQSLSELIRRDKNRPSVVMWSAANEPRTQLDGADSYFKDVIQHIKTLDTSRPTTIAISRGVAEDKAGQYLDIIGFNRYNAWYSNAGRTELIYENIIKDAERWKAKYDKPVLITEYGADSFAGLHALPEFIWTEEYQVTLMSEHFRAFDELRRRKYFIGEMIWNFADFMTAQGYTRVVGNRKGIFTRDRQPKEAAHFLRKRYLSLAYELDDVPLPLDLNKYISQPINRKNRSRSEL